MKVNLKNQSYLLYIHKAAPTRASMNRVTQTPMAALSPAVSPLGLSLPFCWPTLGLGLELRSPEADEEFAVVSGTTDDSFGFNVLTSVDTMDDDSDLLFVTEVLTVLCDRVPVVDTSDKAEIKPVNVEGMDVGVMFVLVVLSCGLIVLVVLIVLFGSEVIIVELCMLSGRINVVVALVVLSCGLIVVVVLVVLFGSEVVLVVTLVLSRGVVVVIYLPVIVSLVRVVLVITALIVLFDMAGVMV